MLHIWTWSVPDSAEHCSSEQLGRHMEGSFESLRTFWIFFFIPKSSVTCFLKMIVFPLDIIKSVIS